MSPHFFSSLSGIIREATLRPFELRGAVPVGGGSINQSFRLEGINADCYFLKLNDAEHHPMFVAEAAGLDAIAATGTLRVPQPITHGVACGQSYLVLEHLELSQRGDVRRLGKQLAELHRCSAKSFGFTQDNFIGTTAQPNAWNGNWIDFWRERRLDFQLRIAGSNGYGGKLQAFGDELLDALPALFAGYTPHPSLLHGDLWSGNYAFLADGTPVIFDPAAYYGDRECDLAMTELFGGFPAGFYAAYRDVWPLNEGYVHRRDLYNLYHILNHANLFGGGYVRQAEQMMQTLLRRAG